MNTCQQPDVKNCKAIVESQSGRRTWETFWLTSNKDWQGWEKQIGTMWHWTHNPNNVRGVVICRKGILHKMNLWWWNSICFLEIFELLIYQNIEVSEAIALEKYCCLQGRALDSGIAVGLPKEKCVETQVMLTEAAGGNTAEKLWFCLSSLQIEWQRSWQGFLRVETPRNKMAAK